MAIFRKVLPTRRDAALLFAACAFPVYVWGVISVLREVPALILRMSAWELVGIFAYTLAFALLESAAFWLVLIVLSIILPAWLFKQKLVPLGSGIVFVTAVWLVLAHYNTEQIRLWSPKQFAFWLIPVLVSLAVSYLFIQRYEKLDRFICSVVERLIVLSQLYVLLSFVGIIIIIVRNI